MVLNEASLGSESKIYSGMKEAHLISALINKLNSAQPLATSKTMVDSQIRQTMDLDP